MENKYKTIKKLIHIQNSLAIDANLCLYSYDHWTRNLPAFLGYFSVQFVFLCLVFKVDFEMYKTFGFNFEQFVTVTSTPWGMQTGMQSF